MADEQGLDLVEISAKADPPVCKILDYQKYVYQQKKKAKEMKANASKVVIKEIRFGPNTDEHDFQFKLAHAREFLQEGAKVKATIFFRGRSIMFKDQGEKQLLRFAVELEEYGRTEHMPVLEGKRMNIMIAPIKKK
jgi:translation initiation factor IF-3